MLPFVSHAAILLRAWLTNPRRVCIRGPNGERRLTKLWCGTGQPSPPRGRTITGEFTLEWGGPHRLPLSLAAFTVEIPSRVLREQGFLKAQ